MTFQEAAELLELPRASIRSPYQLLEEKLGKGCAQKYTFVVGRIAPESTGDQGISRQNTQDSNWYVLALYTRLIQFTSSTFYGKYEGRLEVTSEAHLVVPGNYNSLPSRARQGLHSGIWFYLPR